ncbi:potassium transporter [Emticicia oligotrophica DSM 17448]|uniref:Potassium transporter n=1 Tax=Emticicia oligotrophica (strain DSM 17448 / CIP 109782 / MTCC 6937 / GPTSA100-15) TaxID=929562 RepID=A0ABN4ANA5_EMTOG|nr:KUP/HAK/KT family potassium transporter [Emticicia oligotrophica]AFK03666.1 potassium transporter [Emticicia oligotrophica DSM 17448]
MGQLTNEHGNGHHHQLDKVSAAGLLIALGIVFGDIGTSPLYVLKAIAGNEVISEEIIFGALSCVFWTLTLQTTAKYVILILRADNRGEGGIFALYTLVRRHAQWLTIPAIIGGSTMIADSIITPPISVSSAVEGLIILYPNIKVVPIVITIISGLFFVQVLGTNTVGKAFGPIMTIWFSMLGIFGVLHIIQDFSVFKAVNPYYAYQLLVNHPGGFLLLGSVFLCTTGAEALYSDMGHVGRGNIRISWIFVKICLLLNYFGQGVYVMSLNGQKLGSRNPFYDLMPQWFLPFGIVIAAMATIIASQAMLTGVFTLISEAIRLNFWPKIKINFPSEQKGQIYIPSVNIMLYIGCIGVITYFSRVADEMTLIEGHKVLLSSAMEAAYGLAIVLTMLMNTFLFSYFLYAKKTRFSWVVIYFFLFFFIECCFLIANLEKFMHGGWVSMLIAIIMISVMYIWLSASKIKARLTEYEKLSKYIESLKELSKDITVPKYATHLVFLSNAGRASEIETKIIYSIFQKRPKRADVYWFVHIDTVDDPNTMEYKVMNVANDDVYKVNFRLGFRVPNKINLYFKKVLEDMVKNGEVDIRSRYESLNRHNVIGDFRFVVLERFLSYDNELSYFENLIMKAYFFIKGFTPSEDKWFGLDSSSVKVEKVPLIIRPTENINLKRIPWSTNKPLNI